MKNKEKNVNAIGCSCYLCALVDFISAAYNSGTCTCTGLQFPCIAGNQFSFIITLKEALIIISNYIFTSTGGNRVVTS
jgi:hypothetical protein